MSAVRQQVSYPIAGSGGIFRQAALIQNQILSTMMDAGWGWVFQGFTNSSNPVPATHIPTDYILRAPALDPYWSHADLVYLWGAVFNFADPTDGSITLLGTPTASAVQDYDVQQMLSPGVTVLGTAGNTYSGGPWPAGSPISAHLNVTGVIYYELSPTTAAFTLTTYASEYGMVAVYDNGSGAANIQVGYISRPMGSYRNQRNLTLSTQNPNFPLTFTSPVGSCHLTIRVDDVDYPVIMPIGFPLNASRVAQEITLQTNGHVEASVLENATTTDVLIQAMYDTEPTFGLSLNNNLSISYIDQTADILKLQLYSGTASILTATSFTVSNANWILLGARSGAVLYNRTRNQSTIVGGFSTSQLLSASYDTLLATIPGSWSPTDTFIVMPGPETYTYGLGLHSATYQGCGPTPAIITSASGILTITLNDKLGEAQGHYQIGQSVIVASNGCAIYLTVADISGYSVGDIVGDGAIVGLTGVRGIVRHMYPSTSQLVIDTIQNYFDLSSYGFNEPQPAWGSFDQLVKAGDGGTCITSWDSSAHQVAGVNCQGGFASELTGPQGVTGLGALGWYQRVPIVAIGQVDVANGDYRTTLDIDFSGMNPSAKLLPGMIIHIMGKMMIGTQFGPGFSMTPPVVANMASQIFTIAADIAQDDNQLNTTLSPRWDPDYETGSIPLCELVMRHTNPFGADIAFTLPHIRFVNARTAVQGDDFLENGDAARRWRSIQTGTPTGSSWGAMMNGATNVLLCVGPGAF